MFLPLMPTTPFLILASACFARSSPKMHHYILNIPTFGPIIKLYEEKGIIRLKAKLMAGTVLLGLIIFYGFFSMKELLLRTFISGVLSLVLLFILSRPSK